MTDVAPLPKPPRALLLDFDGVILQSAALKSRAFADLYADADAGVRAAIQAYADRHGGVTRRDKIVHFERAFFGRSGDAAEVDELTAAFGARVFDAVVESAFVPGAMRLLELAHGKADLHLISGTPHDELVEIVAHRGLKKFFASVTGAPPGKRETFARLLATHAYAPQRTIAVGDSLTEYHAACELGVPFLAVVAEASSTRFPSGVPAVATLEPVPALLGLD